MSTKLRPELSKKNPYKLPKHRYYELYHFCLQYPEWKERLKYFAQVKSPKLDKETFSTDPSKPVEQFFETEEFKKIRMVEKAINDTDVSLGPYLLMCVTTGASYEQIDMFADIPCCKDTFYKYRRKFFWILDKAKI